MSFLYNEFGVVLGTANVLLPFLVLPLFAAMVKLDDRLLQAAASLGASRRTIFWRVFFPLTLPSLAAGAILVFILTLGFFITPAILGGGRVPMIANMLDLLVNRHAALGARRGDLDGPADPHARLLRRLPPGRRAEPVLTMAGPAGDEGALAR